MNKDEFLKTLEKELYVLSEKERNDIINEYKDTIEEKIKHGQDEKAAVQDFGDIDELVDGILEAYKINPEYTKETGFEKFTSESEKLIKKGANKLTDLTKNMADKIKNGDAENNLNIIFEIIIKIFCTIFIAAILTIPFEILKDLGFSFAELFFSPLSIIMKIIIILLLIALYCAAGLLIVISLFKPYFETLSKDELSKEEKTKEKSNNVAETPKTKKTVHKTTNTISSVIILIFKLCTIIFIIAPLIFISALNVVALIVSIFYWIKGINLLGLTLILLATSTIFIWFTTLIFNLIFSKKRPSIIPFLIALVVAAFGTLFFIDMLTNIEYIDEAPKSYKESVKTETFTIDKKATVLYWFDSEIKQTIDDNMKDGEVKFVITYNDEYYNIDIQKDPNYTFDDDSETTDEIYDGFIIHTNYKEGYNRQKEEYQDFINNLKENKVYNYSKLGVKSVEIITNTYTMNQIELY